jgi:hypothetical protein
MGDNLGQARWRSEKTNSPASTLSPKMEWKTPTNCVEATNQNTASKRIDIRQLCQALTRRNDFRGTAASILFNTTAVRSNHIYERCVNTEALTSRNVTRGRTSQEFFTLPFKRSLAI